MARVPKQDADFDALYQSTVAKKNEATAAARDAAILRSTTGEEDEEDRTLSDETVIEEGAVQAADRAQTKASEASGHADRAEAAAEALDGVAPVPADPETLAPASGFFLGLTYGDASDPVDDRTLYWGGTSTGLSVVPLASLGAGLDGTYTNAPEGARAFQITGANKTGIFAWELDGRLALGQAYGISVGIVAPLGQNWDLRARRQDAPRATLQQVIKTGVGTGAVQVVTVDNLAVRGASDAVLDLQFATAGARCAIVWVDLIPGAPRGEAPVTIPGEAGLRDEVDDLIERVAVLEESGGGGGGEDPKALGILVIGASIAAGSADDNDSIQPGTDAKEWNDSTFVTLGDPVGTGNRAGTGSFLPSLADRIYTRSGRAVRILMAAKGSSKLHTYLNSGNPQWGRDNGAGASASGAMNPTGALGGLWTYVTAQWPGFKAAMDSEFGAANWTPVVVSAWGNEYPSIVASSPTGDQRTVAGMTAEFADLPGRVLQATGQTIPVTLLLTGGKTTGDTPDDPDILEQREAETDGAAASGDMYVVSDELRAIVLDDIDGVADYIESDNVHPTRLGNRRIGPSYADGLLSALGLLSGASAAWDDVTGKPAAFPPEAHTHTIANVTGLQTALDGKEPTLTAMTQGEAETGTATTARKVSAAVLKAAVLEHGGEGGGGSSLPAGRSTTDLVLTSQTAYQDIPGCTVTVGEGTWDMGLRVEADGSAGDMRVNLETTAGTLKIDRNMNVNFALTGSPYLYEFVARIVVPSGTATVKAVAKQNSSDPAPTTIHAGTLLRVVY